MAAVKSGLMDVLVEGEWTRLYATLDPTTLSLQVNHRFDPSIGHAHNQAI